MNFIITGYYFKSNLGDNLLMNSASSLFHNKSFRIISIDTINIFNTSLIDKLISWTDALILFGGEVINDYFLNKLIAFRTYSLSKFNKFIPFYAFGVSSNSDPNYILSKVDIFEFISFRNSNDLNIFYPRYNNFITYIPDPVFINKYNTSRHSYFTCFRNTCNIGFFLSNTASDKEIIINNSISIINSSISSNHIIHLFTMCNGDIPTENDTNINNSIYKYFNNRIHYYTNINDVIHNINSINFAICWRFHAHILCIIHNIPFISISNTPKVINLINDLNLHNLHFNSNNMITGFNYILKNKSNIKSQLKNTLSNIQPLISKYYSLSSFLSIIRNTPRYYINLNENSIFNKIIIKYNKLSISNNHDFNATLLIYLITGKLKSNYHWGLMNKLKNNSINTLIDDIRWLINEEIKIGDLSFYYIMSNYTNYNFNYVSNKFINIHYFNQSDMKGLHRSGWEFVISNINSISTFHNDAILCDLYIDRTFHWNYDLSFKLGIIPYTKKWIGFIHHTNNQTYTNFNIIELFNKKHFIDSLNSCKGLFVLSNYLKNKLISILINNGFYHIPVYNLYHPTELVTNTFDLSLFKKSKKIFQIGAWYRDINAIFKLNLAKNKLNLSKYALVGPAMNEYYNINNNNIDTNNDTPISRDSISRDNNNRQLILTNNELMSVNIIHKLSNNDYDNLFISSIIFIFLFDASAVNTIIEAIVRNTPILVNKIEPVIEYLGKDYPFYYENIDEATIKLNDIKLIKKTHEYLKKMDKNFLNVESFINSFKNILQTLI